MDLCVSVNLLSNIVISKSRSPALKNDMTADEDVCRFTTFNISCKILWFKYDKLIIQVRGSTYAWYSSRLVFRAAGASSHLPFMLSAMATSESATKWAKYCSLAVFLLETWIIQTKLVYYPNSSLFTYLDCLKNLHCKLTRDAESWNKPDFIG